MGPGLVSDLWCLRRGAETINYMQTLRKILYTWKSGSQTTCTVVKRIDSLTTIVKFKASGLRVLVLCKHLVYQMTYETHVLFCFSSTKQKGSIKLL